MTARPTRRDGVAFVMVAVAAVLAVSPWAGATEGAYLHGMGPLQRGRAGAGVASPRDASWMMLNPGSIVELERRVDVGLDVALSHVDLAPAGIIGNGLAGPMTDHQFFTMPFLGAIWPRGSGAWGLGVYVPSGVAVDFPQSRNVLARLFGNTDRRLDFHQVRLVVAHGHAWPSGWAIGIGVNASLSRLRSDGFTRGLAATRGANEWDHALGAGFCLGAYRRGERWALGAAYQSRQWSERMDKYADLLRWSLDLPQVVQVGLAYDITPSVEVVADYKFIDWSGVPVTGERPLAGGFGWRDQHIVKLGIEWTVNRRWALRAGVSHGNATIRADDAFMNGLTSAGVIEDHFTGGVSYALGERSALHVAYVHAARNTLKTTGRGDVYSVLGAGTRIDAGHDGLTLGYSLMF